MEKKLELVEDAEIVSETLKPQEPKARTSEDINNEYSQLCMMLGDKTIKKKGLEAEMDMLLGRINALGAEMQQLLSKQASESQSG